MMIDTYYIKTRPNDLLIDTYYIKTRPNDLLIGSVQDKPPTSWELYNMTMFCSF